MAPLPLLCQSKNCRGVRTNNHRRIRPKRLGLEPHRVLLHQDRSAAARGDHEPERRALACHGRPVLLLRKPVCGRRGARVHVDASLRAAPARLATHGESGADHRHSHDPRDVLVRSPCHRHAGGFRRAYVLHHRQLSGIERPGRKPKQERVVGRSALVLVSLAQTARVDRTITWGLAAHVFTPTS